MTQHLGQTPLKSINFTALDFETTGMDPLKDEIVEIGIILFQNKEIVDSYHHLVNPGIPVSQEAFRVNGINEEMLKGEPFLKTLLPDILPFFSNRVVIAHNAPFDLAFLLKSIRQQGHDIHIQSIVDSCLLAKTLFPKLPNHRLTSLIEIFNLQCEKAHRALSDAKACFYLFSRCIEELPEKWETSWEEFQNITSAVLSHTAPSFQVPTELSNIEKAVLSRNQIKLSYRDGKGEMTKRNITPVGFTKDKGNIVLVGYCHLRKSTRTFRLDRIIEIEEVTLIQ